MTICGAANLKIPHLIKFYQYAASSFLKHRNFAPKPIQINSRRDLGG
ncbi:MAG: hypothetical protein ACJAY6_001629 [Yoonia sp.]|jgi:hypothetical protein